VGRKMAINQTERKRLLKLLTKKNIKEGKITFSEVMSLLEDDKGNIIGRVSMKNLK
jgi:hypothetical protein